jgi:hypothetical protein
MRRAAVGSTLGLVLLLLACHTGCQPAAPRVPEATVDRLNAIYQAYHDATAKLGRAPRNLNELKPHFPATLPADDLLTSPHDGERYVLVWNIDPRQPPVHETPPLLAFEHSGASGEFDVLTTMGTARISEAELKQHLQVTPGARRPRKESLSRVD